MMKAISLLLLAVSALTAAPEGYHPQVSGQVVAFRLAGIEPDGDPLDQVVLQTRLTPSSGTPALNLIVNSYLENFTPDTTPILPDLLHPNRTAQNLGGFLQGKAIIADNAGNVLYLGSFLAEAFLDNSNHGVMQLDGMGTARGGNAVLKGTFRLNKLASGSVAVVGQFSGHVTLPGAARRQIVRNHRRSIGSAEINRIIGSVTVKPAPMKGKATTGSPGAPLHTGYGATAPKATSPASSGTSASHISPWTMAAGAGAIASFLIAGILFWTGRKQSVRGTGDDGAA